MKEKLLAGLTTGVLLLGMTTMANANLVTNGSFEEGNFIADVNNVMSLPVGSTQISGWSVVNGELGWLNTPNLWGAIAADGSFFLNLAGYDHSPPYGGISQTIPTTPGQGYRLSFDMGAGGLPNWGPSALLVNVGNTSFSLTSDWSPGYQWHLFNLDFIPDSASTPISFIGDSGAHFMGLDNVAVNAVPIPAAGWLFGSALLSLLSVITRVRVNLKKRIN